MMMIYKWWLQWGRSNNEDDLQMMTPMRNNEDDLQMMTPMR